VKKLLATTFALVALGGWLSPPAQAQQRLKIKPLAERRVSSLPPGPLYWRIETFTFGTGVDVNGNPVTSSLEQAQAVAGPWSLAVEADGRAWLFTLGPPGGASEGGTRVAEIGPIPRVAAQRYLLRINEASGPPGSITGAHSHPGSEAFYVLAGETSSITPRGVMRVAAGHGSTGNVADTVMRVSSSGTTDLHSLVMFVVDADRPFATPAKLAAH
jgi:hypothetical protein